MSQKQYNYWDIGSQITNYNNSTNYNCKERLQRRGVNMLLLDGIYPPKTTEHFPEFKNYDY